MTQSILIIIDARFLDDQVPVGISVEYEAVKHAIKKLLNDNAAKTALFFRSKFALCS